MTLEQTAQSIGFVVDGEMPAPRNFEERFTKALQLPPIQGNLSDRHGWLPLYRDALSRVDTACHEKDVCSHGKDHVLAVAQNAFTLRDVAVETVQRGEAHAAGEHEALLSDASVLLPVLIHDLGYGDEGASWEAGYVHEHHTVGSDLIDLISVSNPLVKQYKTSYLRSIANNTSEYVSSVEDVYKAHGRLPPSLLFPLLVMTADKLDYFRSSRLAGIQRPADYRDNPYYFLADAVEQYGLSAEDDALQYRVLMKKEYVAPGHNGPVVLDFPTWQMEVQSRFPHVFSIGSTFTTVLGKRFEVVEAA